MMGKVLIELQPSPHERGSLLPLRPAQGKYPQLPSTASVATAATPGPQTASQEASGCATFHPLPRITVKGWH